MKFRKKISFCTIVLKILLISLVRSFPQTFSLENSYIDDKKVPLALLADVSPFATQYFQHEINEDIWNAFQEPVYDSFNLPEVECPLISKPKPDHVLYGKNKAPFICKSGSKNFPKFDSLKGLKITSNINELILPPEFSSAPSYRDLANFPEVEYPMSASEMWKPNYWNTQLDSSYNNVNTDYYCKNPTPTRNFETKRKPGTQTTFSTKSYSDTITNLMTLKDKGSNNNIIMNENLKDNTTSFLDSSKVDDFHISVPPLSFAPYSAGNKLITNSTSEVCPKDRLLLPTQSEALVNACADIFKDEIKSVLKTMADNIILNNLKKEEVIPPVQLTAHTSDILESNTNCNNLNIYEEFTSPDLLKNRRSQDINEFTKYNKDFFIPTVDFKSKLTSTDFLTDSYADKFHEEMTSILKSNADDFLLKTFENSKSHDLDTKINRNGLKDYTKEPLKTQYNEHLTKDFSKFNYEPILPVPDVGFHTHVDNLHNEMTLKAKSVADNILLNKFESPNHHNEPSFGEQTFSDYNNNIVIDKPQTSSSRVNLDGVEVNKATLKTVNDNHYRPEYKKDPVELDIRQENKMPSTTQAPRFTDVSAITNNNDFKSNVEQDFCKEFNNKSNNEACTSFNDIQSTTVSKNELACKNKESVSCKSSESVINNMDKEDGMFLSTSDKEQSDIPENDSMNKEIELDEEFTTDSYPENEGGDWYSYALSTVAPRTSTVDLTWRDVSVIEPDKSLYPDELDQYFIMN